MGGNNWFLDLHFLLGNIVGVSRTTKEPRIGKDFRLPQILNYALSTILVW